MAEQKRSGVFIDADDPLVRQVKAAGVVGAGGAGFPTHVKLSTKAPNFIINGAECEPLMRVDQQLMRICADELLKGIKAIKECVEAERAYLAVKSKHKEVVDLWHGRFEAPDQVFELEDFYPAGDEQTLISEIMGATVPELGIPTEVGALVQNVETILNVVEAMKGRPVTHKYLTVGGAVNSPVTVRAPVGTSFRDVLELAGGAMTEEVVFYEGGLMTGRPVGSLDDPICKNTKALLVVPAKCRCVEMRTLDRGTALRRARAACDQCRMCTDLCPRYLIGHTLQPHRIMSQAGFGDLSETIKDMSLLCCDCGLCEIYSCPVGVSPRTLISHIKNEEMAAGRKFGKEKRKSEYNVRPERLNRKVPVKRLIQKLGVAQFDREAPFSDQEIRPSHLNLRLKQHIGRPADPAVKKGDKVTAGQVIGEIPDGEFGAHVHAPLAGIVRDVSKDNILIEVK
ncbi:MAG: 4Fe-4S dicluster domain-containing protein [Deltaproteobacteria bacterium]|nr:4Fe-4S dicluster domain-containing protein [Deltaproteobacteria bacterium]